MMTNEVYGRSPAMEVLPDLIEAQRLDREDLEAMCSSDKIIADAAHARFFARRQGVWREMGLI